MSNSACLNRAELWGLGTDVTSTITRRSAIREASGHLWKSLLSPVQPVDSAPRRQSSAEGRRGAGSPARGDLRIGSRTDGALAQSLRSPWKNQQAPTDANTVQHKSAGQGAYVNDPQLGPFRGHDFEMNYDRETSASERSLRGEPALH